MFNAQYLFKGDVVYGPWVARGGDNMWITTELIATSDGSRINVEVVTKNTDDPGDGGDPISGVNVLMSNVQRYSLQVTGLKELVRLKFTCDHTNGDFCLARALPAVWFDAVAVPS